MKAQDFIADTRFSEKLKKKIQSLINIFSFEYDFNEGKIVLSANTHNSIQRNPKLCSKLESSETTASRDATNAA